MDVNRLELLRELAQRGSVTAVAEATNRTPSAVSQQLKVLEREAGVPLTERHGRGLRLTGAGQMLAQTAIDVAVALERADAVWEEFKGAPRGVVTVALFESAGQMFMPGVLADLDTLPGLEVRCDDADPLRVDFIDRVVDFDIVVADSFGVLPPGPTGGSRSSPCSPSRSMSSYRRGIDWPPRSPCPRATSRTNGGSASP